MDFQRQNQVNRMFRYWHMKRYRGWSVGKVVGTLIALSGLEVLPHGSSTAVVQTG